VLPALHHCVNPQFLCNRRKDLRVPLYLITEVREITRSELDLGDGGNQLLRHAVGEVVLCGITGVVVKRQHRQGIDPGGWLRQAMTAL